MPDMDGFQAFEFSYDGLSKPVFKLGGDDQPAVLIMIELPGMTRHTVEFARRLNREGYTIYLPLLFGKPDSPYEPGRNLFKICIQKEFNLLAHHKPSQVTEWLRALCREMQKQSGGPVGAIGMCFTGGFALSLLIDEAVAAPVVSQPGYARGFLTKKGRADLGIPDSELDQAVSRSLDENIPVLGLRFTHDVICPKARFDALEQRLGKNFIRIDIDSSLRNPHNIPVYAHSVLTVDYQDKAGHPTRLAYERLVAFLNERLPHASSSKIAETSV
ncbi:MAG: dienelactone hydrolase family protein [Pseudomonadales bacterium]|nr:dienelactone hydrolase family protein [Pseudomonadales bacterium]